MILSDEYGRILLGTEENPITTYAINAAGWVEAMLRTERSLNDLLRRVAGIHQDFLLPHDGCENKNIR